MLLALGTAALSACFSSSGGGSGAGANFDLDSGTAFDVTMPDAEPDASTEATAPEASPVDASPEDVTPAGEASTEASLPEAAIPDASLPDVAVAEASAPEAGMDAAVTCITSVFGEHYVAPDGTLYYAPNTSTHIQIIDAANSQPLQPMAEVVQQAGDHACGLRGDGTVWCWPLAVGFGNTNGDLGNGAIGGATPVIGAATQVVTSAAGDGGAAFLTGVVHLSTASDTFYTQPTCAIRSDKTVWCWGNSTISGNAGGLFKGSTGSNASVPYAVPIAAAASDGGAYPVLTADQISVGGYFACALSSGKVSCWGTNTQGPLANGDMSLAFQP